MGSHTKRRRLYLERIEVLITKSDKFMNEDLTCILGFAGHRARVPPDPIPNSEVKPRSVSGCSVVFGHANLGKLATLL
jgi:hypothetical protein